MFFDGISYHYIENVERESGDKYHILYKHEDLRTNHTCGKCLKNYFLNFKHNVLFSGFPSAPEFTTNEIKRVSRFILAIITYYDILSYWYKLCIIHNMYHCTYIIFVEQKKHKIFEGTIQ